MTDDITTGEQFAASLVEKVGGLDNLRTVSPAPVAPEADTPEQEPVVAETEGAETEAATKPEFVEDEHGNLHGPDGKFVEKSQRTGEESVAEASTQAEGDETPDGEGEQTDAGDGVIELDLSDPGVAALLEKYDGDIGKTLSAFAEAQSLIGRQGQELGDLRKLEGKLEQLESLIAKGAVGQPQQHVNYGAAIEQVSEIEDERQQNAAFSSLAQDAVDRGDFESMVQVTEAWKEFDPYGASVFTNTTVNAFERAALEERLQQAQSSNQTATSEQEAVNQEVAKVVARHPDLEQHIEAIGQIAEARPYLKAALETGSPQDRAKALEDLYLIARAGAADTSREAIARVQVKTQQDNEQARADAAVVSASRGTAASADQPTKVDEFRAAFRLATGIDKTED